MKKRITSALTALTLSAGMVNCLPLSVFQAYAQDVVANDFETSYGGWSENGNGVCLHTEEGLGTNETNGMKVSGRSTTDDCAISDKSFYLTGEGNKPMLYDSNDQSEPAYKKLTSLIPESQWGIALASDEPIEPDTDGYYCHDTFESGTDNWKGRGGAAVSVGGTAYAGSKALTASGRTKAWNGAQKTLDADTFKAGESYSFSVAASGSGNMMLSLQYKDASNETRFAHIAEGLSSGGYVQLANQNYKLPEGSEFILYVETEKGTDNFTIDEVIIAKAGTKIDGLKPIVTTTTTTAPVVTTVTSVPARDLRDLLDSKVKNWGDANCDGDVDMSDVVFIMQVLANPDKYKFSEVGAYNADVCEAGGGITANDSLAIQNYLLGKINKLPESYSNNIKTVTAPVTTTTTTTTQPAAQVDLSAMAQKFGNVNLAKSYKKENENNPLISQYFGADPGVMEYNGRVYVYMTDDHLIYNGNNIKDNDYNTIDCLRCISSDDLVNWTDHGLINAAGKNGLCKWGGNSWAPTACHKTINGKEKFFIYFANSGNGIAVLEADSPTGPWKDPIGKALISRSTPNCNNVTWLFDPAVFVDDDGKAYLYFGGGVPNNQNAHPKTARAVQLGDNMTSIVGTPVTIDPPYLFEDSGIHKYNGKYYYSYCSNFNTGGNNLGITNGAINYMVSDNPLGPFTYKGEVFKGIGTFFGTGGNNHHTIIKFKDQLYLFYHAQYLQDSMGIKGGYRSTHIDKITVNADGTMQAVKGTKAGVSQISSFDPFTTSRAATFSHQGGITISGSGDSIVQANKGSWYRVSGADCKNGANSLTIKASAKNGCIIKVCKSSASGTAVAYAEIPAGGSMQEITVPVKELSGKNDLYFVFNDSASVDSWKLS